MSGSGSSVSGSGGGGSSLDTARSGIGVLLEGQLQAEGASRPALTTAGGTPGVRFAVLGGGRRSEVIAPLAEYHEGQQMWLHYRAQLSGVPVDTNTWQLVAQFHQNGGSGSPPVALEVGRGRLRLASQGTDQQDLGPISSDGVLDVVLHVVFSRDPARGQVDVSRDGAAVLSGYHPPGGTLLDGGDYLKLGLYRDPAITQPSAVTALTVQASPTALPIDGSGS